MIRVFRVSSLFSAKKSLRRCSLSQNKLPDFSAWFRTQVRSLSTSPPGLPLDSSSSVKKDEGVTARSLQALAASIDTTLTEDQKKHVAAIKKKIGMGHKVRSLYREVPTTEELDKLPIGNFRPLIADNAQELIDYALSFIPKRTGPRQSRRKKRMFAKWEAKRQQDAQRKRETAAAILKKQAKTKKQNELCRHYRALAATQREIKQKKEELKAKMAEGKS